MGRLLASLSRSCSFNRKSPAATHRQAPYVEEEEEDDDEVVVVLVVAEDAGRQISGPLAKLEADLAHRLRHLTLEGGINALNLTWLSDAMAVALSTHSSSRAAIRSDTSLAHHMAPLTPAAAADQRKQQLLLQHHLHSLACLMDDCNALREATCRMSEHLARLHHAIHGLAEAAAAATSSSSSSSSSTVAALHRRLLQAAQRRLSACVQSTAIIMDEARSSRLYRAMAKKVRALAPPSASPPAGNPHPVIQAMDGVTLTTTLILCAAVSSFLTPPATKKNFSAARLCRSASNLYASAINSSSSDSSASETVAWAAPFRQLHKQLLQSSGCGGAELSSGFFSRELAALHAAAGALVVARKAGGNGEEMMRMGMGAARVGKAARDLRLSVAMLHKQACELSLGLAEVRVALLETCGGFGGGGGPYWQFSS